MQKCKLGYTTQNQTGGKIIMKTNTYSVYVNEPLYTGTHPCIAKNVNINTAIKALYDARKKYIKDTENNESHGYIIWDNAPASDYNDNMVFNMHFDTPHCMLNWEIKRDIKQNREGLLKEAGF